MKYTKEDVIMWADDSRLKDAIGKECYTYESAKGCLQNANEDFDYRILTSISEGDDYPFVTGKIHHSCVILRKHPEKEYVPFDFSLREDRNALIGKVIEDEYGIYVIVSIFYDKEVNIWRCGIFNEKRNIRVPSNVLLRNFVFADGPNEGTPVGKELKE